MNGVLVKNPHLAGATYGVFLAGARLDRRGMKRCGKGKEYNEELEHQRSSILVLWQIPKLTSLISR